jgi:hypothetical protein
MPKRSHRHPRRVNPFRGYRGPRAGWQPRACTMVVLIAATAHNAAVYTRNAEDLAGLADLVTVVPI